MRLRRTDGPHWERVGPRSASVIAGGHSHMLAFRYAMPLLDEATRPRVAVFDVRAAPVPADLHEDYWPRLARERGRTTAVVWGGNQHNVSLLLSAEPLTVVSPHAPAPPPVRGTVVPYRMVMALWEPSLTGLRDFLESHPDPASVVVVGTPPPKPDAQVRAGIAVEPYFVDLLAAAGFTPATAPVTDTATRVASWDALQDGMRDIAAAAGAGWLGVPDAARTAEGALRPEFCEADATHANPAYGVLMWHHLLDHVGTG